ncbi:MAG: bifunctional DNA-formamidopyrimidine glycosylase/DNA-(apurinic or apyrimidinic site) lyase [Methylocystis sp.]|nr:bifunctional DNA-formamidopyrimidine glycosylase/DNA-(apurinic or apyrimidinic site) lyase [Methylocystis sp.]MCA3582893.1 bifunctional DNA-formamidopyrimidine glycosylase/DNA-(apurinic or apyrimidinic site) lyase [Methylocystis sp.]MCA3589190.1 bifunctional DNA-formamidopyrimidine glycosylase/DNA-(apurinic or apyrimidinic site) lyase [Methylocystis sp.]MCA3590651.1 bifunctional DNA-formamidopyrimidine glycosylase/DNA-(apurinic or apyrimidinic site) lyase [Methylocystis sp.]
MPELPEVETVRRGLQPVMEGRRILSATANRADLRFPFPERFAVRLAGRTIISMGRRAKYLMADLDDGEVLVMHLGMTGRFLIEQSGAIQAPGEFAQTIHRLPLHDHVVFEMEGGARITYNDVRRFGFMDLIPRTAIATHPLTKDIGIEPLGNELTPERLAAFFSGKAAPLKAALLDQRQIAGLGNIYVCEALFRAGLSPRRAAGSIIRKDGAPTARARKLTDEIRLVLQEAIEAGGSTLRDFAHADGSLGYFQHRFKVYDREGDPCPNPSCAGVVERIVQSGRSTFFCATCQR